ncbi:transporter substrate-binding domain-containing protein [Vibrio albus]|nr:transporter substrate-binding domain-containing protein [Vibrio albus]
MAYRYTQRCVSILLVFVSLLLIAANCFADTQKVSLRLQWKHQFEFAGFYAAKEQGYYRDAGIDVDILEYDNDVDMVTEVTSGKTDFGIWGSGLIELGMQGEPVMLLANYFKRSPLVLATQPDIRLPSDLVGKTLMISEQDIKNANYTQMFNTFKVDTGQIDTVPPTFNMQDFIDKKVDAVSVFLTNEPFLLQKDGIPYNIIDPNNYGVELYDVNLFTSKMFAEAHPELTEAFINASNRGWQYALNHQEETVDLILNKYNTQNKSREHLLFEAQQTARIVQPKNYPIGSIDLIQVNRIGRLFTEVGLTAPSSTHEFIYRAEHPRIELSQEETKYIRNKRKVSVAMMPDFTPFSFTIRNHIDGFEHDLLDILSDKTGLTFEPVIGIWNKGYSAFKAKEVDIIASISYREERLPFTLFTDPYYEIPIMIYVRDDFGDYEGLDSLTGKKVGILKDVFYASELKKLNAFDLIIYETYEELTKALVYGQVDALMQNLTNINALIKQHAYTNLRIAGELQLPSVSKEDLRLGIRADEPILHSIIQKAMDDMTTTERMTLVNKWLGTNFLANENSKNEGSTGSLLLTEQEANYLQEKKVLRVSNETDWPPYDFFTDNQPAGYSVGLIKLLAKQLNIKVEFVTGKSWEELVDMFCSGEIDLLQPADRSEKISGCGQFSQPIIKDTTNFVTRSNFREVHSLEDLYDTTIATPKGWEQTEYLQNNYADKFKFYLTENTLEAIEAVRNGKADFAADYGNVLRYLINQNHYLGLTIQGTWDLPSATNNLYIATPHNQPVLLGLIDKAIASVPPSTLVSLSNLWFGPMTTSTQDPTVTWSEAELKYLDQKKQITMCVDPDWLPLESIDEESNHTGIAADILQEVMKNSGLNLQLVPTTSWQESIQLAKQRQCDIFSLAMETPERLKYMNFTRPYVSFPFVIATRNTEIYIDNMAPLVGKKLAMLKGYAPEELLGNEYTDIDIIRVDSRLEGMQLVRNQEVFGYVDALPPLASTIQKEGITDIRIAGKLDKNFELSIATRNDEALLLDIMQKALDTVSPEAIRSIYNKWLAIRYESRIDYSLLYKVVIGFAFIAFIGFWRHRELFNINKTIEEKNQQLQQAYKKYFWLAENMDDVVWVMNTEGKFIYISPSVEKLRGYTAEEVMLQTLDKVICEGSRQQVLESMQAEIDAVRNGEKSQMRTLRIEQPCRNGSTVWTEVNARLVVDKDTGEMRFIGLSRDITQTLSYEKQLENLALTDRLTGIFNRHKLDEILTQQVELTNRYKSKFAVMILDIDHFKQVNDTFGHHVGDSTLTEFAHILSVSTRQNDIAGRWGGEEFLIIVPHADKVSLLEMAEKLRKNIEEHHFDTVGRVTASIGVAIQEPGETVKSVLSHADEALYMSKQKGRNRVTCYRDRLKV